MRICTKSCFDAPPITFEAEQPLLALIYFAKQTKKKSSRADAPKVLLRQYHVSEKLRPVEIGRCRSAAFRAGKCGPALMYALCCGRKRRSTGNVLVNDGERTGGLVIDGGALRLADGQNDLTVFHGIHAGS